MLYDYTHTRSADARNNPFTAEGCGGQRLRAELGCDPPNPEDSRADFEAR